MEFTNGSRVQTSTAKVLSIEQMARCDDSDTTELLTLAHVGNVFIRSVTSYRIPDHLDKPIREAGQEG